MIKCMPKMQLQQQLQQQEEEQQPQEQILCGQLKCPRCSSSNTKFCYYNNYNKSQPRHFCKACRRHWTLGGTLRNVPVGGARKNKRIKAAAATTTTTTTTTTATTNKSKNSTSCSSSSTTSSIDNQEQPWQSNREVARYSDYVMNYNDLNREDDHNMKISLLSHHLPCTFPFIASSSTELIGTSTSDHTCLISPFNAQFGQFTPSSSASTTSSDSHNYMSSTAITTNPSSSTTITDCVDSLSWDYLDTLVSTDLKLPWEDYFQTTQEPVI